MLAPFAGRQVVVRTLDAGSDKPLAFATHEGEENPALGVRGLRLAFEDPGLLERQLDAVAEAARLQDADQDALAALILAERLLPAGPWVAKGPGVVMIATGLALL